MSPAGASRPKRRWAGALCLVAVAAAVGCGGEREHAGASAFGAVHPCRLLPPEEVKRLVNFPPEVSVSGAPVYAVVHIGVPGMAECIWSPLNATGSLVIGLAVGLAPEAFSKWKRTVEESAKTRPIEGLGQEAAWAGSLVVREDDFVLGVKAHAFGDTEATSLERSKLVAAEVLERMQAGAREP